MKFQKLSAFEHHFKEAFPRHLSPIYIVVCGDENERKKILADMSQTLKPESDFKKCSQIAEGIDHLYASSLFGGKMVAIFDGVESLLKEEMALLTKYVSKPSHQGCLLLGSSKMAPINELYKFGKNEIVLLDLTKEKPWEEKERFQKWTAEFFAKRQKKIGLKVVETLLNRLPSDRILIENEIEKLLCYIGERNEVTLEDVDAICSSALRDPHLFEMAREIVWGSPKVWNISEISFLLPLVSALRSQFEIGLKMTALLKKGATFDQITQAFPRLWPKLLNEYLEKSRQKKEVFFKRGLKELFRLELSLKTSRGRADIVFSQFLTLIFWPRSEMESVSPFLASTRQ